MYAVLSDRGRQFRATTGDKLTLDRNQAEVGASIDMPVLLIADEQGVRVGSPFVAGVTAVVKVIAHERGKKGIVGKFNAASIAVVVMVSALSRPSSKWCRSARAPERPGRSYRLSPVADHNQRPISRQPHICPHAAIHARVCTTCRPSLEGSR
jgi:large subunit ribosomal protein L21